MSREQVRKSVVGKLAELQATVSYPMDLPGHNTLDPTTMTGLFLKTDLVFQDSWQASLSSDKHLRAIGQIRLEYWYSCTTPLKEVYAAMQTIWPHLHMSDAMPGVRTMAVKYSPAFDKPGNWKMEPILIPFWYDEFTA